MKYKYHKQYRLPYYNYASTNLYFVTICTYKRQEIFGRILNSKINLSDEGKCVEDSWKMIPVVANYAGIDVFVIMPNHIHGIIAINNPDEPRELPTKAFAVRKRSLSNVVRNFKTAVTTKIRKLKNDNEYPVWQSRFYDRIIRNEKELNAIRNYIINNPVKWEEERNNPENLLM
ncbi:MAG: transposase [Bacteroidota bacterium]